MSEEYEGLRIPTMICDLKVGDLLYGAEKADDKTVFVVKDLKARKTGKHGGVRVTLNSYPYFAVGGNVWTFNAHSTERVYMPVLKRLDALIIAFEEDGVTCLSLEPGAEPFLAYYKKNDTMHVEWEPLLESDPLLATVVECDKKFYCERIKISSTTN